MKKCPKCESTPAFEVAAEWMMRDKSIDHPLRVGKLKCCQLLRVSPKAPCCQWDYA